MTAVIFGSILINEMERGEIELLFMKVEKRLLTLFKEFLFL